MTKEFVGLVFLVAAAIASCYVFVDIYFRLLAL